MEILTNPVTISVIVLCVLSLLKLNVLLAMLIACVVGGLVGGIPIYTTEDVPTIMSLLTGGFSGNATTALSYILLGTFATAIATTGLTEILSKKLSRIIGGKKLVLLGAITLIAILSQNLIPVHIAYIPILIPPMLAMMNQMKLDRRAAACCLAFGHKAPYIAIPMGFGLQFMQIIRDNLTENGMPVTISDITAVNWILALAMVVGLLIAVFITYRKPREYKMLEADTSAQNLKGAPNNKEENLMKKLLCLALAALMSATVFAGCNGQGSPESSSAADSGTEQTSSASSQENEEPVKMKWALWDIDATAYYQPLLDAYKEKHPNVEIEMVDLGSTDYQTVLATQLSGGANDLDIITIKDIPGYSNLVNLGMLEPLNDINTTDTAKYNGTIEQITIDDKYYAIPFRSDIWVVFYNKDLFDKANVEYPTNDMTIDEFDELARKLTSGSGAEKVYGNHYHTWRSTVQLLGVLDGKNTIIDGNYDFCKPYYEMVLSQQKDGIVQDYATLKASNIHYSGVFYNNQTAMMNMGSWFLATQIESVKSGESLATNWGMVKYPHPDGVEAGTTLGTITSLGINSKSANKEAAADFINFVCGEEGAEVLAKTGTLPAIQNDEVVDTIASMEGFPTDENSKEALRATQVYLEMPMHDRAADIEVVLNEAHDNIMTENVTIDEGIKAMNEGVQAILDEE